MEVLDVVRNLRERGLVQGIDFDFEYRSSIFDISNYEMITSRGGTFHFKDPKWATIFRIQYGTMESK